MLSLAIVVQLVHLLYHQVTTLVDFFPFNGVRFATCREHLIDAVSGFVPMALPPLGFIFRRPDWMEIGVVCNFVILGGEIATWWIPYFFGPSPKWLEIYSKIHRQTITVLPRRGTNPVPNLEHLILMALTVLTTIVSWVAYRSTQGAFSPQMWKAWLVGGIVVSGVVFQCGIAGKAKSKDPAV